MPGGEATAQALRSYRQNRNRPLNKKLAWILKLSFSVGVLGYLAWRAQGEGLFREFLEHDKNWTLFAVGGFAMLVTLMIQFLRWRLLVRALDLELSPREALRLGFMGQLFSLLGVGMLGGDALKTFYLGRHNQGRMTEALTTVLVDRVIGLYGLIVLAGIVCCFFDASQLSVGDEAERAAVQKLCWLAPGVAVVSTLGLSVMLLPGVTTWAAWDLLAAIPKVGTLLGRLTRALRLYRQRLGTLSVTMAMSFAIHFCNCVTFYCISMGLPAYATADGIALAVEKPSVLAHATASLLALAAGALPVGGLEIIFNVIYRGVAHPKMPSQQGFLIVLAYRLLQMCIAVIGLYYYLAGRREVDGLMHEAAEANEGRGTTESGSVLHVG